MPDADRPPTAEPEQPKPRRKRKTRAEKEAEQAAKLAAVASGPLFAPEIWMILGGALLIVGACIYFDPISFAEAGQTSDNSILRSLLILVVGIFGKNPTALVLAALGLLSLGWGVRGWLKARLERGAK